jgi:hypothetical protein
VIQNCRNHVQDFLRLNCFYVNAGAGKKFGELQNPRSGVEVMMTAVINPVKSTRSNRNEVSTTFAWCSKIISQKTFRLKN